MKVYIIILKHKTKRNTIGVWQGIEKNRTIATKKAFEIYGNDYKEWKYCEHSLLALIYLLPWFNRMQKINKNEIKNQVENLGGKS